MAGLIRFPNVMEVNPAVPARTVPEFIAYAKANPGKLNMASSGNGSTIHVSGELFKMMAGVSMAHVPYRGGAPAMTAMIGGQVQVMFDNLPTSVEYIRAGKLRPFAVTSATRPELLPDVPMVADFVPGYEASAWYGIGAPKSTPAAIIDRLTTAINAVLADPEGGAGGRHGRDAACGFARRVRQIDRRRNREVGQGGQSFPALSRIDAALAGSIFSCRQVRQLRDQHDQSRSIAAVTQRPRYFR